MNVLLAGDFDPPDRASWTRHLAEAAPGVRWLDLDTARADPAAVDAAVVARLRPGELAGLPALRLVQALWAGVERLLADPTLPAQVPLARMVDPAMTRAMVETARWAVLSLHRGFFAYARQQRQSLWQPFPQRRADQVQVGVLGQGALGGAVAQDLRAAGYAVWGWRRSDGEAPLRAQLPRTDIVVNLLPLTAQTRGFIDARFLAQLPRGANLVNLARGAHVVEADLLLALDSGRIGHAVLDVFQTEPLPATHLFWQHPRVTVLPHAAALTDPQTASRVVAENLRRLAAGEPLLHVVDRQRGY